jgi:tetratricopeptide (TPR) repeat protein
VYSLGAVLHKISTGYSPSENTGSLTSLPIDLQYILRKALRTEPEERYDSAEALANDLRAFLEWKPVQARSGDTWYRARKFVRRYRVPVLATALLIFGLSVGLYAVNRERKIAQRRFDQVRQLSNKILALDDLIQTLPGSTQARSEIMAMSQQYLESLIAGGETSNDLALEVATAFRTLAEAQGVPVVANLGESAQASENLVKADILVEKVLTGSPRDRKALLLSATINEDRMILASLDLQRETEKVYARKSADRLEYFLATNTASDAEKFQASRAFANIALAFKNLHLYDESVRYGRRVLDVVPPDARKLDMRASALSIIADSLRYSGDLKGALETVLEAESEVQKSYFSNEYARVKSLQNIMWRHAMILGADGQISLGRTDEAIAELQQAFDLIESAVKKDSNDAGNRILFVQDGRELGNMLRHRNPAAALAVFDHARRRVSGIKDNARARRGEAELLAASSYPLRRLGRVGEAEQRINQALDLLRQTKSYPADAIDVSDELHTVLFALGDHLADQGRLQQATDVFEQLLDKLMASHPDPENDLGHATALSGIYGALTSLYRRGGRSEQANTTSELRIKLWQNWYRKLPASPFIQQELSAAQTP